MPFWEIFYNLCESHGTKPNTVAKQLGFSSAVCTQWKKGLQKPSAEKLRKIAEYFEVSVDYLIGAESKPTMDTLRPVKSPDFTVEPAPAGFVRVPVIGEVAAGMQCLADMEITDYIACDASMINDGYEYCYLKVKGDSMEPLIREDDMVLVRIQNAVPSGSYAVVLVDDDNGLVKRVEYDEQHFTLISENPYYPPRKFVREDMNRIRIFGLVVETRRRFV